MTLYQSVTAKEVMLDREATRIANAVYEYSSLHGFMEICPCPNCRDEYDPTGKESAAFLNCEPSYFDKFSFIPIFSPELFKKSFYSSRKPGIYVQGPIGGMIFPSPLKAVRNAILDEKPSPHILRIFPDGVQDHYYLNESGNYSRFTYVMGLLFLYKDSSQKEVSPENLLCKIAVLNPEEEYEWEETGIIPIDSGGYNCDGCEHGYLNQVGHMGPGGCLEEKYEDYCINCGHIIPDISEADFSFDESIFVCEECEA